MEPETIIDTPFPLLAGGFSEPTGSATNAILGDNLSPTSIKNTDIPNAIVSVDTISTKLNTETGKILGQFNFEQLGAIKIGQITISPKGILGVDTSGATTFALDPDTGSATFVGSITGGTISIGSGNAVFKVDVTGNVWAGNTDFNSAPWRVTNVGVMNARTAQFGLSGQLTIGTSGDLSNSGDLSLSSGGHIKLSSTNTIQFFQNIDMSNSSINGINVMTGNNGLVDMNSGHNDTTVVHHLDPESGNSYNLGGSSRYWFAINYHFLTKQGGFGHFDKGVEMQDGKKLSPTESLLAMKPHKSRTEWGVPIYDFETLPKMIRVYPKTNDGKLVSKNKHGKYIDYKGEEHSEGEDVNAMISLLISSVRELTTRLKVLEVKSI